mmetsp:Transcript_890/g.3280  ORF Transcript_890/g.3280 Transcript_890/m.3280 type:complete len:292 (+) Transcript_890:14-889(+)
MAEAKVAAEGGAKAPVVALVRGLSQSFERSLRQEEPEEAIDVAKAEEQHKRYVALLRELVEEVIEVEADEECPDCNFIEDTAFMVGELAIACRPGAMSRRNEVAPVLEILRSLPEVASVAEVADPGTVDGGDVLAMRRHVFIGLSSRSNEAAVEQTRAAVLAHYGSERAPAVVAIAVPSGLHLKSAISYFDAGTILYADTAGGREVAKTIAELDASYTLVPVPHPVVANILRVGRHVVVQEGICSASTALLQEMCTAAGLRMHQLCMSELVKADGALTCGSILVQRGERNE